MYHTSGLNKSYSEHYTKGVFWALNIRVLMTFAYHRTWIDIIEHNGYFVDRETLTVFIWFLSWLQLPVRMSINGFSNHMW